MTIEAVSLVERTGYEPLPDCLQPQPSLVGLNQRCALEIAGRSRATDLGLTAASGIPLPGQKGQAGSSAFHSKPGRKCTRSEPDMAGPTFPGVSLPLGTRSCPDSIQNPNPAAVGHRCLGWVSLPLAGTSGHWADWPGTVNMLASKAGPPFWFWRLCPTSGLEGGSMSPCWGDSALVWA